MLRRLPPLVLLLACPVGLPAAYLTRVATPAEQWLRAVPGGRMLIRQTAEAYLAAGVNEVTFLLPAGGATPEQAQLRPLTEGVTVRAVEAARENPGWVRWLVDVPREGAVRFVLTCPLPDLTWEMSYALRAGPAQATWEAWVRLANKGAQDYKQVPVEGLPWGTLTASLPPGGDARFPLVTLADLPLSHELRWEPDRSGDAVVDLLTIHRSGASASTPFGAVPIPSGRLEVTEDPAPPGLPGKTLNLPYTPQGCDLILSLGAAPGLNVTRRLVSSRQVNVRLDVDGRPALYDLDEQYELTVSNKRATGVTLTLIERLAGPGTIRETSQPHQPADAGHICFALTAPAQTDTRITYLLRRTNLEP